MALSGFLGSALSAVIAAPAIAALLDPGAAPKSHGDGAREYARLSDLRPGVPRRFDVLSIVRDAWDRSARKAVGALFLVRRPDSRVEAFSAICPHLGCFIDYDAANGKFVCPCHQGEFDAADGRCLKGPSPRGLDPLPVQVRDEKVFVTYEKFVLGIRERRRS